MIRLCIYIYIYTTYTPNLGLGIVVSVRQREQGRWSSEGAGREHEVVRESIEGAL